MSVHYVHEVPTEATNRWQIPCTDYCWLWASCGFWAWNLGFTREAGALIAELCVLPRFYYFRFHACVCVYMWVCACESEYLGYRGTRCSWSEVTHGTWNLTRLLCRRRMIFTLTAERLCNPDIHNLNNKRIPQINKCNKDRMIYEVQIFLLCWKDHIQCLFEQADSSKANKIDQSWI